MTKNLSALLSRSAVLLLLPMSMLGATVYGQTTTEAISGVVRNEQGEGLKEVNVIVVNGSTGAARLVRTDKDGRYLFADLEAGDYQLYFEGQVVPGKAITTVKAIYPPTARLMDAYGTVKVEVTVSETGSVIDAKAISGHKALRPAAVYAARQWIFEPTTLNGSPIKMRGVLYFNFQKSHKSKNDGE
jgi:TonB family protein